jgi:hypothetical protein
MYNSFINFLILQNNKINNIYFNKKISQMGARFCGCDDNKAQGLDSENDVNI